MADRKQTISNLQVLPLLGRTPCPASVGRQAPHAVCLHWHLGSKNRLQWALGGQKASAVCFRVS